MILLASDKAKKRWNVIVLLAIILFYFSTPLAVVSQTSNKTDYYRQTIYSGQTNNAYSNHLLAYNSNYFSNKRQDIKVKIPKVKYSDIFSMDIGSSPVLMLIGETFIPIWVQGKYAHPVISDEFYIGGSFILGSVIGKSKSLFSGVYANMTTGTSQKNVGIGIGYLTYGFTDEDMDQRLTFVINGKAKINRDWVAITDNYFFNTEFGLTGVITFRGRKTMKRMGVDIGLVIPIGGNIDTFLPVPWAGIHFPIISD